MFVANVTAGQVPIGAVFTYPCGCRRAVTNHSPHKWVTARYVSSCNKEECGGIKFDSTVSVSYSSPVYYDPLANNLEEKFGNA